MSEPPPQVFCCYAHADEDWRGRLEIMLAPLIGEGALELWSDTRIRPGQRWFSEIKAALERARVAVFLLSPDFLASEFIRREELPELLRAREDRGMPLLWVPVRPCLWEESPLARLQAAWPPEQPLATLLPKAKADQALKEIAQAILEAAEESRSRDVGGPPAGAQIPDGPYGGQPQPGRRPEAPLRPSPRTLLEAAEGTSMERARVNPATEGRMAETRAKQSGHFGPRPMPSGRPTAHGFRVPILLITLLAGLSALMGAWLDWGQPYQIRRNALGQWHLNRGLPAADTFRLDDGRGKALGLAWIEGGFWRPSVRVDIPDPQARGSSAYRATPRAPSAPPPPELARAGEVTDVLESELRLNLGLQQGIRLIDRYQDSTDPERLAVVSRVDETGATLRSCGPWARGARAVRVETPDALLNSLHSKAEGALKAGELSRARSLTERMECLPRSTEQRSELSRRLEELEQRQEEAAALEREGKTLPREPPGEGTAREPPGEGTAREPPGEGTA